MKETFVRLVKVSGFSVLPLAVAAVFFMAGCRTVTQVQPAPVVPAGPATSLPSAGIVGITPIASSGNSGDFEIDLFVVDSSGHALTNLAPTAISMVTAVDTTFTQTSMNTQTSSPFGPYSAELLLDQTGSIRTTDPLNLRLIAAKLFLEATALLPAANEVQLSTFQDSLGNGVYMQSYGGFTHNTAGYIDTVALLASRVGGGTPLYDAMYNEMDSLDMMGHNPNKVLVVFTDGQDNESYMYYPGATLWDAIHHAVQNHVKVFAIALQTGLDTELISAAMQTGGAIMHTNDAKQMVSYFSAMSNFIQGGTSYYKTKWHVSLPHAYGLSGQMVSGNLSITLPDNSTVIAPFAVTFP
jgi:hypothetical protein